MYNKVKALIYLTIIGLFGFSCADTAELEERLSELENKVDNLEDAVSAANTELIALGSLVKSGVFIVGYTELENGYTLEISTTENSQTIEVIYGADLSQVLISIDNDGYWIISTDGGETWSQIEGAENAVNPESAVPELTVDSENYWCIRFGSDGEYERILDTDGNPISATASDILTGSFRNVEYDEETGYMYFTLASGTVIYVPVVNDFYLTVIDFIDKQTIRLNETLVYDVEMSGVKTAHIVDIPGWAITLYDDSLSVTAPSGGTAGEVTVVIYLISTNNLMKTVSLTFTLNPVEINANAVKEYRDFLAGNVDNVLLDFSYAGYEHGETAPPDVAIVENGGEYYASNGYTVYDVTKYGAVPNDGLSDREAFLAALKDAVGAISSDNGNGITFTNNTNARAIVYFPEGEYILHTKDDDIPVNELAELPSGMTFPEGYCTQAINIRASNFILKGAGRDKTKLVMKDPAYPTRDAMYSSPAMLAFRHNTSHTSNNLTTITGDSPKGSFSVEVASSSGISAGDRVCLYVLNNTQAALESELGSYLTDSYSATWTIVTDGVEVEDYHEVASVSGNTVTFKEPLMHAVDASWGWQLNKQSGYSNVGVEDLTFVGNAKEDFEHHGSWQDDGAYKPLYFVRLTDSWIRRVGFESVSEALSITSCANVSAYDITITGNRGHSSIRAERSSRVFIGAVTDSSNGRINSNSAVGTAGDYLEGAGQYHAVGVSKPSIGTVLWRNQWGKDACFEAHATQPRATLIDCCTGGWMQYRQGGDAAQMPNHLADLTIWNFESMNSWSGTFDWWNFNSSWWKFLPPIIVGFHGYTVSFNQEQVLVNSENGSLVEPESLYEAQLRNRLGYVPAWLNALKS